ncbi:MAG: transcription termination/antitermination protein NusA [candidate division WS1 bacterium]|jgi:N utilization substance protein A|nr:transcription termination/antitermination protein NusA [candidate division WS1 bacterium]
MDGEFIEALEQLQKEKDISMSSLLQTVEAAMSSAYRKHYGSQEDVRIEIDPAARRVRMFARKALLPEGEELILEEGQPLPPDIEYEEHEIDTAEFGRIAAQTAKQVVMQRIREAEREMVFDEFSARLGEVVTGEIQRRDGRNVYVALGRVEAILPASEQIPGESYRFGQRLKVYVLDVKKTAKSPQIVVSRTHPALVTRLFELEVPEVYEGIVEIKSVAREAGARSKVAVSSNDPQVDPVGACVGHHGARVQAIVDELRGEKIDIVRHNDEIKEYLKSALSPARVKDVVLHEELHSATVIAPDDQLSLAIGRRGQNVRLAAQLTGWKIDIRSEAQWAAEKEAEVAAPAKPPVETRLRVYELARQLGIESRDLVEILQEQEIDVTSHASTITHDQAKTIRELLMGGTGTLEDLEAGALPIELEENV